MSISDVQVEWPMYRLLVKAMYTGINSPGIMKTAIANIGPFPDNDPGEWSHWLHAYGFIVALNDAVDVTNAALMREVNFVAATNEAAALVVLQAPDQTQVADLIAQLQIVNGFIQNDQRFAAALKIGKALANSMSSALRK